jgi:hypothetical protein
MAITVPAVAIGTFAGLGMAPAMAGTAHHPVFREETIRGFAHNDSGIVPIVAYGAFYDHGWVNLNGPDPGTSGLNFKHGVLRVYHKPVSQSMKVNPKSCYFTFKEKADYWITGGTGRYRHAKGWGVAHVSFSGVLPKKNGKCNENANPLPGSALTTFQAQGPVSLH